MDHSSVQLEETNFVNNKAESLFQEHDNATSDCPLGWCQIKT